MDRLQLQSPAAIAPHVGADPKQADRAALLAKADLVTDMVGEFPELQGLMGRYYALHDGEAPDVASRDRAALLAALRRRPAARRRRRAGGRPRRKARGAGRHVRHRPDPDRRQGSVRTAARGARRDPDPDRKAALRCRCRFSPTSRSRRSPGCPPSRPNLRLLSDFIYDRLRGYLREQGYTANQIAAVVDTAPVDIHPFPRGSRRSSRSNRCPNPARSRPRTSGSSTSCGSRRATPRRRSTVPASPTAPSTTCISRSRSSIPSSTRISRATTMRRRSWRLPARSRSSTVSSTT